MSSLPNISPTFTSVGAATVKPTVASVVKPAAAVFFFRSDSIKKIKCTAVYPFQVAVIKFSQSAVIELLESNIRKARVCAHNTMLRFYCVILKLLSTLLALYNGKVIQKARKVQVTTVTSEKKETAKQNDVKASNVTKLPIDIFHARLQEKLAKFQAAKTNLNDVKLADASYNESSPDEGPSPAFRPTSMTCSILSTLQRRWFHLMKQTEFKRLTLSLSVHAALVLTYLQIVILAIALNTTYIPGGLILMFTLLVVIGYILTRISSSRKHPTSPQTPSKGNEKTSAVTNVSEHNHDRQGRSRAERFQMSIEYKYKMLSKVKLL